MIIWNAFIKIMNNFCQIICFRMHVVCVLSR